MLQTAVSVLVLSGAVIAGWSLWRLQRLPLGFMAENRAVFRLQLPAPAYPGGADRARFALRLVGELARRPDVRAAGLTTTLPIDDVRQRTGFAMEDAKGQFSEETIPLHTRGISPGYLPALGVNLREGRGIEGRDLTPDAPRVALVSEVIARKYWPGASPLGRRVRRISGGNTEFFEIVGVAANVQDAGAAGPAGETIYLPLQFTPSRKVSVVVQGAGSAGAALAAGREAALATDPALAVFASAPLEELSDRANALPRLQFLPLALFATIAVAISMLGAYGVTSQLMTSRGREFAVRLALGATPARLWRAALVRNARLGLLGAAAGVAAAVPAGQALAKTLYDAGGMWWTPCVVGAAVVGVLQLASLLPTWRGLRVDLPRQLAGE